MIMKDKDSFEACQGGAIKGRLVGGGGGGGDGCRLLYVHNSFNHNTPKLDIAQMAVSRRTDKLSYHHTMDYCSAQLGTHESEQTWELCPWLEEATSYPSRQHPNKGCSELRGRALEPRRGAALLPWEPGPSSPNAAGSTCPLLLAPGLVSCKEKKSRDLSW